MGSVVTFTEFNQRLKDRKVQKMKPHVPWIIGIIIVALAVWYFCKQGKLQVSVPGAPVG